MGLFAGRKAELKILGDMVASREAELLAIYGRRRVGKTYLISEFFRNKGIYFEFTGIKDARLVEQLANFAVEYSRVFGEGERRPSPPNWMEAMDLIRRGIEKTGNGKKVILFFDELPWLASPKSGFLEALEHFWNRYLSRNKNVIVVICGSAASWMIKNVIYSKGGLHGRVTRKIRLLPFTLSETEEFLTSRNISLGRKQIVELYMALGGIPQYLKCVEKGRSAAQTINDACFSPNGLLFDEFNRLFRSLFDNFETHVSVIRALAQTLSGLVKNELLAKTKLPSGGTSSHVIRELEEAGFIAYMPSFGRQKTGGKYRLIDEYSLFHLVWVAGARRTSIEGVDKNYWLKKQNSKTWNAWAGHAFENICLKHAAKIKSALGISGVGTEESGWSYVPAKGRKEHGAQIDLLIDRADNCINLCETKFHDAEFVVTKEYAKKLENKKRVFKERTGTRKTLFTTLITTYGTAKNEHAVSVVDNDLTMDDLF